jgi:hypothetical protein
MPEIEDLKKQLSTLIKEISSQAYFSPSLILENLPTNIFKYRGTKRFQSIFADLLLEYRQKKRYGRLEKAILLLILLEGKNFFQDMEAKGLLLCDENVEKRFLNMLNNLLDEIKNIDSVDYQFLYIRLSTYINFCHLNSLLSNRLKWIRKLLRNRSPMLIKALLASAELFFIKMHFHLDQIPIPEVLESIFDAVRTPEDMASIISNLVWKANDIYPIKSIEFETPIDDEILSSEFRETLDVGIILYNINEISKRISCFGYELHEIKTKNQTIFKLIPPNPDFEYYLRLGYIRDELSKPIPQVAIPNEYDYQIISMYIAAHAIMEDDLDRVAQWVEYPYPRLRLNFPYHDEIGGIIYKSLVIDFTYFEDLVYSNRIKNEYLIFSDHHLDGDLTISYFLKIYKALTFLSFLNISALSLYHDKHGKISYNSLLRAHMEDDLIKLLSLFGLDKSLINTFLSLISWDSVRRPFYDLQYNPFLKRENKYIYLPASLSCSDILRNTQVSNKIRFREQGENFVKICQSLLDKHFNKIASEKRIKSKGKSTEIDIIVFHKKTLYLFECKYSAPPCSFHEIRNIWSDIRKGIAQQLIAKEILSDQKIRQDYLTGWFPGTTAEETVDINIKTCVITSNRIFGGMNLEGVPVRDFPSFMAIMTEHITSFSIVEPNKETRFIRYSLVDPNGFTEEDLDEFLSSDSKFFKIFHENMASVTLLEELIPKKIILAKETFLYSATYESPFDDYISKMDKLGFHRLPDERKVMKSPMTLDELKSLTEEKA